MIIRRKDDDKILNNRDARQSLYGLRDIFNSDVIHIVFSERMLAGKGHSDAQNPGQIIVGIKGINDDNFPVNDVKYVSTVAAVFHELRHAEQYYIIRYQDDYFGQFIAVSQKACVLNKLYADVNYFINPCEIDAERTAIMKTYQFCSKHFGGDIASKLICKYVNNRVKNDISFIYPDNMNKYNSVVDILCDFDDVYEYSLHSHRTYYIQDGLLENDSLAKFLTVYPQYKRRFLRETDGFKQDMQSAAVAILYDGESADGIPVLEHLTLFSVFGDVLMSDRQLPDIDYDDEEEMQDEKE